MESLEVEMFRDTNGFLVEALEKAIGDKKPQEGQRLGDKFPHLTSELVQQVDQLRLIIKGLRSENGHRRSFSDSQSARAEGVAHCNAEAEIESLLPAYDGDRDALLRDCEETEARLVEVIDRKAA